MTTKALFNYITNYITLSDEEVRVLTSQLKERTYLKHQFLLQQGDVCKNVNFILSGCTRMFAVDDSGTEHVLMFAVEDWWSSDLGSFISQEPADYNVQCLETTKVLQITYEDLENLYHRIPKLERLFRKIIERAYVASQKRIVRNFSLSAKERYIIFKETYPLIEQRVPQYMLASYLGITKEFLSKIKSQLLHK